MNKLSTALAAAALTALPMMASAVTVNTNVSLGDAPSTPIGLTPADNGGTINFTALDRFKVAGFGITGNGSNRGVDLRNTTFSLLVNGIQVVGPTSFTNVFPVGGTQGLGVGSLPGATFAANDIFSVVFAENSPRALSYTVSFTPTAVPVPAAGLLLLTALGGAAALRRRKKAVAA